MKRKLALLLTAAMVLGAFVTGCGSKDANETKNYGTEENAGAEDSTEEGTEDTAAESMTGNIKVVSREDGSGTRGAFIELFGVEQKNDGKECHNHAAHSHKLCGYISAVDLFQRRVTGKRQQNVKNHNCEGGRQQVGQIGLPVIGDGVARQPPVG